MRRLMRYGYRRIRIFLKREGGARTGPIASGARRGCNRPRPVPATAVNHVWAYDFVFDTCANGQTLKCLTVVDEWTRESLAIDVAGGIRSGRVIEVLTQLVSVHGAPRYLRSDNGPEFVAGAILRWLLQAQIETALIEPGKPWQNADESYPRRVSEPAVVSEPRGREGGDRAMAIATALWLSTPADKAQLRAGSDRFAGDAGSR